MTTMALHPGCAYYSCLEAFSKYITALTSSYLTHLGAGTSTSLCSPPPTSVRRMWKHSLVSVTLCIISC